MAIIEVNIRKPLLLRSLVIVFNLFEAETLRAARLQKEANTSPYVIRSS
jgi:hypothetical protein